MATPTFDLESAIKGLREGKDITGKNGVLAPLIKHVAPQVCVAAETSQVSPAPTFPENRGLSSIARTSSSSIGLAAAPEV